MTNFREALRKSGAHPTGLAQGQVWQVDNQAIRLDIDMHRCHPPADKQRWVVIVDSDSRCADTSLQTTLVVPLTGSVNLKRPTSVRLAVSKAPFLRRDSLALVHLVQPIARHCLSDDEDMMGRLDDDYMADILAMLAWALGMIDEDASASSPDESA